MIMPHSHDAAHCQGRRLQRSVPRRFEIDRCRPSNHHTRLNLRDEPSRRRPAAFCVMAMNRIVLQWHSHRENNEVAELAALRQGIPELSYQRNLYGS